MAQKLPAAIRLLTLAFALWLIGFSGEALAKKPSWFFYQRPATYEAHLSTIKVPTRDGTKLGCDLYRPANGGAVASGRFPGIVHNFQPYPRSGPDEAATYFAERGYVVLVCNNRGTMDSEGTFGGWLDPIEIKDNYDIIEWMATQRWSTGRIGQQGVSYGGFTSFEAAWARPPHLVAIAPQDVDASYYLEILYPGGIRASENNFGWPAFVTAGGARGFTAERQLMTWNEHSLYDSYWEAIEIEKKLHRIKIPVLSLGGWYDFMRAGDVYNYQGLGKRAWMVTGPYAHGEKFDWSGGPVTEDQKLLGAGMLLAWFDHWLMKLPGAPLPSARVTAFEMPESGGEGWQELADFPPPDAPPIRMHLRSDGELGKQPGRRGTRSYEVNPFDGPAAICFPTHLCNPLADQRPLDARRLTFTTSPLDDDLVIAGNPVVHLKAALSATDGNLVAKLMDVAPDGSVREASVGYLKASHRLSHSSETPVVPNEQTAYRIDIWPVYWRFQKGHQVRLSLTSGDRLRIDTNAPAGTVTVATGGAGSFVDLPVRAAKKAKPRRCLPRQSVVRLRNSGPGQRGARSH